MGLEEILEGIDGIQVHVVHGDASDLLNALTKEPSDFEKMYARFRQVDKTARGTYSMLRGIGADAAAEKFGRWHKDLLKQAIDFMEARGVPDDALDKDKDLEKEIVDYVNGLLDGATKVMTEILDRHKAAMRDTDITDLIPEVPAE